MKIGVISGTFHPDPGGPPTYLYHLLPEMVARGHQVRVVTVAAAHDGDYGYPVERIVRRGGTLKRWLKMAWGMLRLGGWADTLYVQGVALPLLAVRPFVRGRIVTKVVSDFSWEVSKRRGWTALEVDAFQKAALPPKLRLLRFGVSAALKLSHAVITPSEHVAALVRGWGIPAEKVHVVTNAIPDTDLATVPRQVLRAKLGLPLDAKLLVSVGRLTAVKGFDVAIRALAQLPNATLIVVGEGEQRSELEQLATQVGGRVLFVGRQAHDVVLEYIRAADVFVLSSHTEGLSHVLLESLAVATPAVATAVGGNPEILSDGVNGLLVPPNQPSALATAITRLLTESALAERISTAALAHSQDYLWSNTVNRTEQILRG